MITKLQNVIKTNKTAFWRTSSISPLFQSSFRGPFLSTSLTRSDFFLGARGGEYTSPFQNRKNARLFQYLLFRASKWHRIASKLWAWLRFGGQSVLRFGGQSVLRYDSDAEQLNSQQEQSSDALLRRLVGWCAH